MNPCSCLGINITWSCNAACQHCFYRRNPKLHSATHKPLQEIIQEMREGKARGINRVVFIGEGEPMLHPKIIEIIQAATFLGLKSNVITNGTLPVQHYEHVFRAGLNHIQISAHATGLLLDRIMGYSGAGEKQTRLMEWLVGNNKPFRTNTSLQQLNFGVLPEIILNLITAGSKHISLLGFLPHYEWQHHIKEVAVHPVILQPYVEKAADSLIDSGCLFTIRYHPFCLLTPRYWKYITNARYVLYDPWEWDYGKYDPDPLKVWPEALNIGESVAIQGTPCNDCLMRMHCGGWNRHYAEAYNGAALKAITEVPEEYGAFNLPGALHDMNPANRHCGVF